MSTCLSSFDALMSNESAMAGVFGGGAAGLVALVATIVAVVLTVRRNRRAKALKEAKILSMPLLEIASIPDRDELISQMSDLLAAGDSTWPAVKALANKAMAW